MRTDLLSAPAGTRVADIAIRWGAWHMGQLAADDQDLFNSKPSPDLGALARKADH